MDLKSTQSLKGYEILDRIGSGGFGAVYSAYQTTLGREIAIKIILPGYANKPEFIRRFETEAQLVARLEHLHIVPLYDYWRDPEGAYLVMRLLRGGSVKDALADGPFELEQAALVLNQAASGLAAAHAANVIHRDIKPSNILLDEDGNAYLADFGIATVIGQVDGQSSENIVGSPDYLSPEQARSQPVTPQTDIYGLGVSLYEMIAGSHPFPGLTGVERLYKHINDPLPPIESIDSLIVADINDVIQQATAKNPKYRYSSALELAAAFQQAAKVGENNQSAIVESLTLREQEILSLIVQGKSNREIADSLFIEVSTVKWYIRQIYPKLGVGNRRQAINRARGLTLLVSGDDEEIVVKEPSTGLTILPAPVNPFKGLRPFETADVRDFFGREEFIEKLLSHFKQPTGSNDNVSGHSHSQKPSANGSFGHRFLAIVGPSGSGKSSLVQAGLIPALVRGEVPGSERWFVVQMAPGTRPIDELEVALLRIAAEQGRNLREQLDRDEAGLLRAAEIVLPKDGSELVIYIDQFEELFTLTSDESVRQRFLDLLNTAVRDSRSRIRVIIALRADYYDRPLHYPLFGDLIRSHMETVLPLSADSIEKAILMPLQTVDVSCDSGLVRTIIEDVMYQPGGLPLLQYALTELFERRSNSELTMEAYREIGGVTGALARRAEDLYLEQSDAGRESIRQMLLRLVVIDDEKETAADTRRRVLRSELNTLTTDDELMEDIVSSFASYRLLTLDHDASSRRPTVEIAHEALLREWDRMGQWLEDSRDDLYQRRRLQLLTQEWVESGHSSGLLLHKTRLDQFTAWEESSDLALTIEENDFLDASTEARRDRRLEEEERRQRELEIARQLAETERERAEIQSETAKRLRRRAFYLGGLLLIAAVLAIFALYASGQSTSNAETAQENADLAKAQELLAVEQADAAATAEMIAQEQRQAAEGERELAEEAVTKAAAAQATAEVDSQQRAAAEVEAITALTAAEAQSRLATARELSLAANNQLDVDPELSVMLALEAVDTTLTADGFALAEAESSLHRSIFNLRLESVIPSSDSETCQLSIWCSDVTYSDDGMLLAASGPGNTAIVRDGVSGEQLAVVDGHDGPVIAVAIGPDSSLLATASQDGSAMIWDLESALISGDVESPLLTLIGHTAEITDVAFSPDGSQIATASRDNTIKLWAAGTGLGIHTFEDHESSVRDVAFSLDGTELYSVSSDGTARIWDIAGEQERLTLNGHLDRLTDLAIDPSGERLATASWDSTVKIWTTATGDELLSVQGDNARVYSVAFSPDGSMIASGGTDTVINIWDAATGEEMMALAGHKGLVYNLAFSPDGKWLSSGAGDETIHNWNITRAGNREWQTLDGHNWVMFGVDFNPDGSELSTASWDGAVKIWDPTAGMELQTILADQRRKMSVEYSPDGSRLAATTDSDSATIWDTTTWEEIFTLSGHQGPILDVAFSPDGLMLATVGEGGEEVGLINLWNTGDGSLASSWIGHESSIERVAINPDGTLLATASTDGTASIWQLPTGDLITSLSDHQAAVNSVNFSHDGRYLGTAGRDNTARIYDFSGQAVELAATLIGHSSAVWDVVFSPDDSMVATISFDESVKLWDPITGKEILTLPGSGNNGREVAFSPDGKFLAATSGSGLVRIYVLAVEDLMDLAESRVARKMSAQECQRFLHVDDCSAD